ncbi:MAG: hypothetical protein AAF771_16250 [Pseudomonadota bacterium]
MNDIVSIGTVPWTDDDIRESYAEFTMLYAARPIADNANGMRAPHAFGTWFMLRALQPDLIIESGVWRGLGTWLIAEACPDAELICLDVDFAPLTYRAPRAEYRKEDFSIVDFSDRDLSNALCFFDDHQDALMRLQQMRWKGFRQAIFEDNYPQRHGDCYSLKKMWGGHGLQVVGRFKPSLLARLRGVMEPAREEIAPNLTHRTELMAQLARYYEFPPLFRIETTRWGDPWSDVDFPTRPPIFGSEVEDDLRAEAKFYTWMCLVDLK